MRTYSFYLSVILFFIVGCSGDTNTVDDFSTDRSLFVNLISSHTAGVVSVASDIQVRLANALPEGVTSEGLQDVFTFSPVIEGKTELKDDRTLVFTPSTKLKQNQKYEVSVDVESVLSEVEDDQKEFRFIFQTLIQNFEVEASGFKLYDPKDLTKVKIEGILQTADVTDFESLKSVVSASQNGKDLEVQLSQPTENHRTSFIIANVVRSDKASEVEITVDGESIEVDKEEEFSVEIPALGDYKVISTRIVKGDENYISVLFSDPLDPQQNLTGMVALSNTNNSHRMVIDLNEIKIYPTQEINTTVTLTVSEGIKNSAGYPLKENFVTTLEFIQAKPEVKLVNGSEKSILPNSNGLILPFEAISLRAVDVTIVRVYEDNMLQYLQVNSLGGQSELRRVGKPIIRKTIPLNTSGVTNLNAWNRFTLDLNEILKTEPGAFYQINIGFKKQHSLYFCADNAEIQTALLDDDWGAEDSESYWDSYDYYYNPDYNWQERDNPCSNSYYGNRRTVSKMLFASNLGIIAKQRDKGSLHAFVTDIITTEPLQGVDIQVYDYQQQVIGTGQTDSDGKVEIPTNGTPFVLLATQGEEKGYLKLDDGSSLSLSNFDVTGSQVQKGLKGFLYGERGVWRPADTVHLGFMLEDVSEALPENHPVILELYNPSGQLTHRQVNTRGVEDMYRFDLITSKDAPTGNWRAVAKVGGASFGKTVKIETIKPNRLKIDLNFEKEKFTANDYEVVGDLAVKWLTGATASNLKVDYDMMIRPVKTEFKGFPNYIFDDASRRFDSDRIKAFEGKVDQEGNGKVRIKIGDIPKSPGALQVQLYGKVYEEGGDFSISNSSVPYYPYKSFVGLKAPSGDKRGMLLTDEDHTIQIATVDAEGNPISRSVVHVKLYKLRWRWWWDNSYESISNYVGRSYNELVIDKTAQTQNGKGTTSIRVNRPGWGRYYLQVEDPVSGHSSGQIIYIDWPGWAGKGKRGELDGATMLDFSASKETYQVGEEMKFTVPSTKGNRILVSLETGSELLESFWVETMEENTEISIQATSDMAPNIYMHLSMLQPHSQSENDLPIRLYGVKSIAVEDPKTRLQPTIEMPSELKPEQTYTLKIGEEEGRSMGYTIAIVDEGLLDITNFKTPDPWSTFYAREALGIKTWDIYDDVIGAFSGEMDYLLAVGGDGEINPQEDAEVNRFKPVVRYLGPFLLEKGESNTHKIKMPPYVGSVKTMVIAASKGSYGRADKVTPVKQPMMVMATLPRVIGPGEAVRLPVNVFTLNDNIKSVSVKVEAEGQLSLGENATKTVKFSRQGDKVVDFEVLANKALGSGKITVTATSGSITSTYEIDLEVLPRNPMSSYISEKILSPGESWETSYEPAGLIGQNGGYLEFSTMPPLNIQQRLSYLIQYPHGCIEQTTSSVFAQLYLSQLLDLSAEDKQRIQNNIQAAIERLKLFQLPNGGFAYWPGMSQPNLFGSNYAGHFLLEAKKRGYNVPESMISSWVSFQTRRANNWNTNSTDHDHEFMQAYRLYTLSLAGSPVIGAMNRLKEKSNVPSSALWRLALTYATAGYESQARDMIQTLSTTPAEPRSNYYRYSYGSEVRDMAMILETLLALDEKEKGFDLLTKIAETMGDSQRWLSTQTTAYSFIAISKYAQIFGLNNATILTGSLGSEDLDINTTNFVYQQSIPNPDKSSNVELSNGGETPVFVRVIRTGIPLEGGEVSTQRNIDFAVNYTDMQGNPVDISTLKQGTNFKALVTIANPGLKGNYTDVALTQIFPSGWEIVNTRLDGSGSTSSEADYIDIRDDRVMHYFDLDRSKSVSFEVLLIASYSGRYYLPAIKVEAMYDNTVFATNEGRWIEIQQ